MFFLKKIKRKRGNSRAKQIVRKMGAPSTSNCKSIWGKGLEKSLDNHVDLPPHKEKKWMSICLEKQWLTRSWDAIGEEEGGKDSF